MNCLHAISTSSGSGVGPIVTRSGKGNPAQTSKHDKIIPQVNVSRPHTSTFNVEFCLYSPSVWSIAMQQLEIMN